MTTYFMYFLILVVNYMWGWLILFDKCFWKTLGHDSLFWVFWEFNSTFFTFFPFLFKLRLFLFKAGFLTFSKQVFNKQVLNTPSYEKEMWIFGGFFEWHLEVSRLNNAIEHSSITNSAYLRIVAVYFVGCHWSQC